MKEAGAILRQQQNKANDDAKDVETCRIFVIKKNTKTRSNSRRNCGWSGASTTTQENENRNANRGGKYADRLEMSVRNKHNYDVKT
jgi:hypothetical protein